MRFSFSKEETLLFDNSTNGRGRGMEFFLGNLTNLREKIQSFILIFSIFDSLNEKLQFREVLE